MPNERLSLSYLRSIIPEISTGNPTTLDGSSAAPGSSTNYSPADHKHAIVIATNSDIEELFVANNNSNDYSYLGYMTIGHNSGSYTSTYSGSSYTTNSDIYGINLSNIGNATFGAVEPSTSEYGFSEFIIYNMYGNVQGRTDLDTDNYELTFTEINESISQYVTQPHRLSMDNDTTLYNYIYNAYTNNTPIPFTITAKNDKQTSELEVDINEVNLYPRVEIIKDTIQIRPDAITFNYNLFPPDTVVGYSGDYVDVTVTNTSTNETITNASGSNYCDTSNNQTEFTYAALNIIDIGGGGNNENLFTSGVSYTINITVRGGDSIQSTDSATAICTSS